MKNNKFVRYSFMIVAGYIVLNAKNIAAQHQEFQMPPQFAQFFNGGIPFGYNGGYNAGYDPRTGRKLSYAEIAKRSIEDGAARAISDTTRITVSNGISFVPSLIKSFGLMWGAFFYRLLYGSRGLTSGSLRLLGEEINRAVHRYTVKSYASNDRVQRLNAIGQELGGDVRDTHWEQYKTKIKRAIDAAQAALMNSLPCYDSKFSTSGYLGKMIARCAQSFSSQDNEQISRLIVTTHSDLETLKNYITSFKSLKEVEQNIEHIKAWLTWTLGDLEQLGSLLDGEVSTSGRSAYRNGGAMTGQAANSQIAELLNAAAAN